MPSKKLTRKRVNDPTIDSALRDVYDELDKLQPSTGNPYLSSTTPEEGDIALVTNAEGDTVLSGYTSNGWMVDINSNFQPIGTKGFISALGEKGRSGRPIKGEALKYNENNQVHIGNAAGSKVLLKNTSGVLKVRNANDSADAIIKAKRFQVDTGTAGTALSVLGEIQYDTIQSATIIHGRGLILDNFTTVAGVNDNNVSCSVTAGDATVTPGAATAPAIISTSRAINVLATYFPRGAEIVSVVTDGSGDVTSFEASHVAGGSGTNTVTLTFQDNNPSILSLVSDTGNQIIKFVDGASPNVTMGYDRYDNMFKIHHGTDLVNTSDLEFSKDGNLTVVGTITSSAGELGVGDITGVTLTGDSGGALSDTSGSADFTIAGGTNCASAGSGSTITVNVDDAFIKNDDDDTMAGTLTIDKDINNTSAQDITAAGNNPGLRIDYDRVGAVTSGTDYNVGLNLDMDVTGAGTSGTPGVYAYGIDLDLTGDNAGSGTSVNIGMDIYAHSADTNIGIHTRVSDDALIMTSLAEATDFATLGVATDGVTTLTTTAASATTANLIFDAGGDIALSAGGGDITMDDGAGNAIVAFNVATPSLTIYDDSDNPNDYFKITVGAAGGTSLKTVDDDGINGHLTIEPDGHVEYDGCGVGFGIMTVTYGDVAVGASVDSGNNTDVDFRFGNKAKLTLTGGATVAILGFVFPAVSGNFSLILSQDGVGSGVVTDYKAYESDASDATVTDLVWAGGSEPTLTTTANKSDIISIYWDEDAQKAYATITHNF